MYDVVDRTQGGITHLIGSMLLLAVAESAAQRRSLAGSRRNQKKKKKGRASEREKKKKVLPGSSVFLLRLRVAAAVCATKAGASRINTKFILKFGCSPANAQICERTAPFLAVASFCGPITDAEEARARNSFVLTSPSVSHP